MGKSSLMRAARRWTRPLLGALVIGGTALLSGEQALSQAASSPTDLLQIFQSLPQEQQDALLRQFGASGGGAGGLLNALGGGGGGGQSQRARQRPSALSEEQEAEVVAETEPPGLKGEDWVIIQVALPGPKPAVPTVPVQAVPALPPGATQNSLASLLAATTGTTAPVPPGEVAEAAA